MPTGRWGCGCRAIAAGTEAEIRGRLEALGIFRASGHEHLAGSLVVPVLDEAGSVAEACGREGP